MKTKILVYTFFISLIIIFQSTLMEYVRIYDVKPNLMVIFVVAIALLRGSYEGAAVGFFTGLFQDMAAGKVLGFYALIGLYLGLTIGLMNKRLYRENFFVLLFFTFAATVIYESVIYFLAIFFNSAGSFLFALKSIILPEAIYNSIVSLPVYIIIIRINHSLETTVKVPRRY